MKFKNKIGESRQLFGRKGFAARFFGDIGAGKDIFGGFSGQLKGIDEIIFQCFSSGQESGAHGIAEAGNILDGNAVFSKVSFTTALSTFGTG